ncbi:GNAT family N-acetyltransferase [Paenibacillus psychroresistens]|uniref:GNAT family N-acetyltransferase n=1 Tax=Paenibacillus psychroresistens TaxID=1778678 RepID=A0A6B8RUQ5_9BACL|nr:GNAT family N-acetyltransferase [Paenibacillus psychroresistens]QGQ99183.1 GNAT family N-acetyltransferase [Paenibacillus psychroresistens]
MGNSDIDASIRVHIGSDTDRIVTMINRDPYHMLNGLTVAEFDQNLDEPLRRIRDNTFVVEIRKTIVGYFSLCFVEENTFIAVDCFGTVDMDWRRRGIGTAIFNFIFNRLESIAHQELKLIRFKHRALTSIPAEVTIGVNLGMLEQNTLEILCLKNMVDQKDISQPLGFHFRNPTLEDANDWVDIYNEAFGVNKSLESVIYDFQGDSSYPNLYLLITNEFGDTIGLISSILRGTHARIPTIAVRREWQKRGIGRLLLSEILKRLKQSGADDVRLTVESTNYVARSLYNKFGFQQEYKRIHYVTTFLPKL